MLNLRSVAMATIGRCVSVRAESIEGLRGSPICAGHDRGGWPCGPSAARQGHEAEVGTYRLVSLPQRRIDTEWA